MPKNKVRKDIKEASEIIREIMREGIKNIADLQIKQIMKNYRNSTPSQQINATKDLKDSGVNDYKNSLLTAMAVIIADTLQKVRKEVPTKKKITMSEWNEEALQLGEYDKLPKKVKKRLKSQVDILVKTQKYDIDKSIALQFSSSVVSTDDEKTLEYDLFEASRKYVDGPAIPASSSVISARGINEARQAYFSEDEVLEEIEAFQFKNDIPVTPICQDLNGTIFSANDPGFDRYQPPLHFNALLENQWIKTIDDNKLIQNIELGDLVKTHLDRYKKVTEVMTKFEDKEYFEIELENGFIIKLTGEHPVLCKRGWIRTDELRFSDDVITM